MFSSKGINITYNREAIDAQDISVAHASTKHFDPNFIWFWWIHFYLFHFQWLPRFPYHRSCHKLIKITYFNFFPQKSTHNFKKLQENLPLHLMIPGLLLVLVMLHVLIQLWRVKERWKRPNDKFITQLFTSWTSIVKLANGNPSNWLFAYLATCFNELIFFFTNF